MRLYEGDVLCRDNEPAFEFWIIEEGQVQIRKNVLIATREAGDLIGEAAFYRIANPVLATNVRGATVTAVDKTSLFRIDRKFIADLEGHEQAVWHETVARVLTAKLDEATENRDKLKLDRIDVELLVSRFVSPEGRSAARAALQAGEFKRQLDAESCEAVVWFSDIAGFSSFASECNPEVSSKIIRSVMDIQADAIHSAKGEIDKFMGDGLMAFWRAPDRERIEVASNLAVSAALSCERELRRFFDARSLPLGLRIGLHSGPVILGDFGGSERIAFTLIGETVNSANRYEQAKCCVEGRPLGPVRISPRVFALVTNAAVKASFEARPREFADKHNALFSAFVSIAKEAQ